MVRVGRYSRTRSSRLARAYIICYGVIYKHSRNPNAWVYTLQSTLSPGGLAARAPLLLYPATCCSLAARHVSMRRAEELNTEEEVVVALRQRFQTCNDQSRALPAPALRSRSQQELFASTVAHLKEVMMVAVRLAPTSNRVAAELAVVSNQGPLAASEELREATGHQINGRIWHQRRSGAWPAVSV